MMMLKDLKEFTCSQYVVAISGLAGLISPGLIYVAYFRPDLLFSLDIIKLGLLSFSLSLPTALLCGYFICVQAVYDEATTGSKMPNLENSAWVFTMSLNVTATTIAVISCHLSHLTVQDYLIRFAVAATAISLIATIQLVVASRRMNQLKAFLH